MSDLTALCLCHVVMLEASVPGLDWDSTFDFWYYRCLAFGGIPTA